MICSAYTTCWVARTPQSGGTFQESPQSENTIDAWMQERSLGRPCTSEVCRVLWHGIFDLLVGWHKTDWDCPHLTLATWVLEDCSCCLAIVLKRLSKLCAQQLNSTGKPPAET